MFRYTIFLFLGLLLMSLGNLLAHPPLPDWVIRGTVTDVAGLPIKDANVTVKNNNLGTSTDAEGHFSLKVPENSTLVISSTGYKTLEQKLSNAEPLFIVLESAVVGLDEFVVVGYGTQRKSDVTSAISNVNVKNLEKQPAANIGTLLQGQAP